MHSLSHAIVLAFANAPDYEAPSDAGTNNVYEVTVTISDGTNSGSTISYTVTVDDVAIAIPQSQTGSVSEAANADTTVMTVTTSGDTAQGFSIASGNDDGIFAISNAGVISIASTTNLIMRQLRHTPSPSLAWRDLARTQRQSPSPSAMQTIRRLLTRLAMPLQMSLRALRLWTQRSHTDSDTGDQNTCALSGADAASYLYGLLHCILPGILLRSGLRRGICRWE